MSDGLKLKGPERRKVRPVKKVKDWRGLGRGRRRKFTFSEARETPIEFVIVNAHLVDLSCSWVV